jgi:hypothetical protein
VANELKFGNKVVFINGNPITLPTASSDPGSATAGDLYYNSTSTVLRYYNGSVWSNVGVGTVTSVNVVESDSGNNIFNSTGGPITSSGTINLSLISQNANLVFAGPTTGGAATPTFRNLVSADIPNLSSTYLVLSGGTMTGNIDMGTHSIVNMAAPVNPNDAVTKAYVDNFINATSWKNAVLVATTGPITLSGEQTIDGFLTSSSRVLVKNQGTASQNGIYVSNSGAWTRAVDMSTWAEVPASAVFVQEGTANGDIGWVCTAQPGGTLGSTAINFVQFSSAGAYSADGVTLQLVSGVFSIKNGGVGTAQLGSITDGITLDQSGAGSTLEVKTGGISNAQVSATAAIAFTKLANLTSAHILVGNGSNQAADVAVSGDLTLLNTGAFTVAKIAGTTVTGATGTGNVVFSASPTFTGTITAAALTLSSSFTVNTINSTGTFLLDVNGGASAFNIESTLVARSTDGSNFISETYNNSITLTDNSGPNAIVAFQFAVASFAGEEITYVIESGNANADCRIGTLRITANNAGTIVPSLSDMYSESADCGVSWSATNSAGIISVKYTASNQGANRTMRADIKQFIR